MPVNTDVATRTWVRYAWCRDNGHQKFIEKADTCDRFFRGDQWRSEDLAALKSAKRPAMTINKILSTVGNVLGEQIRNRAEISFRPKSGAPAQTAEALTKVFKHISDTNRLDWLRSDMFADGVITSRGFLDIRIGYKDSVGGEVEITHLNPKNVIIDPDAENYDPDTWADVLTTKWMTADDIAVLYNQEDAEYLRNRQDSYFPYGYDSIQAYRDRVGDRPGLPDHVLPEMDFAQVLAPLRRRPPQQQHEQTQRLLDQDLPSGRRGGLPCIQAEQCPRGQGGTQERGQHVPHRSEDGA